MDDKWKAETDQADLDAAVRFALGNGLPLISPKLTAHELRKHPEPDTRTRQQRRHEERKGVRQPDQDAAAVAAVDAKLRADRKTVTSEQIMALAGARKDPTDPAQWGGKLNIYTCEGCRAHIVSRDLSEGVTPFMLSSKHYCPNKCGADEMMPGRVMMTSSMYRVYDQSMREDYQWYAPDAAERSQASAYQRDHYNKGGLEIRKAVFDD